MNTWTMGKTKGTNFVWFHQPGITFHQVYMPLSCIIQFYNMDCLITVNLNQKFEKNLQSTKSMRTCRFLADPIWYLSPIKFYIFHKFYFITRESNTFAMPVSFAFKLIARVWTHANTGSMTQTHLWCKHRTSVILWPDITAKVVRKWGL